MVKMNAIPLPTPFSTKAKIAKTNEAKTEVMADSWGLLPKGVATKNVQLASDRGNSRLTSRMIPTLVPRKIRAFHARAMMIQPGRYASEMLRCQELSHSHSVIYAQTSARVDPHDSRGILEPHRFQMASEKVCPFTRERPWKVVRDPDVRNEPRQDVVDVPIPLEGRGHTIQAPGCCEYHGCSSAGAAGLPVRWSRY